MKWGMNGLGLLMVLSLISATQAEPSGLLNDTGQTQCLNVTGTALEECTPENSGDDSPFPGQDGRYGRDAAAKYPEQSGFTKPEGSGGHGGFAFTPLDVNGNPIPLVGDPPVPAETPRCVWDRVTNLIWEVKTDDGGLQDKDWTYGWGSALGGGVCGGHLSDCNTNNYINAVSSNTCRIDASGIWRMPTRRELLSIVDYGGYSGPRIDVDYFPFTMGGNNTYYWSSDSFSRNIASAWQVSFDTSSSYGNSKNSPLSIRLVRDGPGTAPTASGMTDNGDGTVSDMNTGLMWDQCSWGQTWVTQGVCSEVVSTYDWSQAIKVAFNANRLNWRGHSDWRLPSILELESLVDMKKPTEPAINEKYFPNTPSGSFFSSTVDTFFTGDAHIVNFRVGTTDRFWRTSGSFLVRLVRGGKSFGAYEPNFIRKSVYAFVYAKNKTYDGSSAAEATCSLYGVDQKDDVECKFAHAEFYSPNPLNYRAQDPMNYVTVSGINISGTDAYRYRLQNSTESVEAWIYPRTISASITAQNKVYDGTTDALITGCELNGILAPDNVLCEPFGNPYGTFSDKNAGKSKQVQKAVSISSYYTADAYKYTLEQSLATTTADIIPREVVLSHISIKDKIYDGTVTAQIEAIDCPQAFPVQEDNMACAATGATFIDPNAGINKKVSIYGLYIAGNGASNYIINPDATAFGNILKAPATVTLANLSHTYTGSPLSPSATTNPANLAFTWTGAPQSNVGSYPVTATVNDQNYEGSASGAFVIGRAQASVSLGNLEQTFTGSPLSPTITTIPSGLPYTLTGAPQINAGRYTVTASNPNYTGSASGTFVIQPKAATVSLSNLSRTYTGSLLSPTVTTTPAGLSYTLTGAPQTNAGSYPVTATITNPNYTGTASGTFVIAKAAQAPVYLNAPAWVRYQQAGLVVSGFGGTGSGTFSYSATGSTACTVHPTSGVLTITSGTGTCQVTATRSGGTNYLPASSTASVIQVNKALQAPLTISANPPSITSGGPAATLSATGGTTSATVTYAAVGSAGVSCIISANTLKATGSAGTCSVTGTMAGNGNYEPVSSAPLAVPVLANVAPVAVNDAFTLLVNGTTPVTVAAPGLLANDTDANRDALKVAGSTPRTITLANSGGRVTLQANGSFTYTPPSASFSGSRSFTYQVTDGKLTSNTATVTLAIARRPTANADTTVTALNTAKVISVLANDSATAPATLNPASLVIVTPPANGSAQANANGTVTYTPTTGFAGTNTFTYSVRDSLGSTSNPAIVTVHVPQARPDSYSVTANTSTSQTGTAASVGLNDVPNVSGRTFTRLSNPIRTSGTGTGTLTITSFNASTGAFSYRLSGTQANKRGTYQFSYRMSLGGVNTAAATVTITVR